MLFQRKPRPRRAVAAAEMGFLAPILLMLLVGVWEVGRYVMVQNILDNAAREGARLAASGGFRSSNNSTTPSGSTLTMNPPSTNTACELQQKIFLYLQVAGVSTTNATVKVENTGSSTTAKTWNYTQNKAGTITGSGFDPAACADQLDNLQVTVTLPYTNVGWSPVNWFVGSSVTLTAVAGWSSLKDVPLTISTTIPTKPLQSTDPLP
jgi:Flp pilus assembly protein TadG